MGYVRIPGAKIDLDYDVCSSADTAPGDHLLKIDEFPSFDEAVEEFGQYRLSRNKKHELNQKFIIKSTLTDV